MAKKSLLANEFVPRRGDPLLSHYPRLYVEVPKPRWRHAGIAADMRTLFAASDPERGLLVNRARGMWGVLARLGLLRTNAQFADYSSAEGVKPGATSSQLLWGDRVLVTVPYPSDYPELTAGVLAYRAAALQRHKEVPAMAIPDSFLSANPVIAEAVAAVGAAEPRPETPLAAAQLAVRHVQAQAP